ncbi:DUF3108 domain-containing protein [Pseudomonadota bacterium]
MLVSHKKNGMYLYLVMVTLSLYLPEANAVEKPRVFSAKYTIDYSIASGEMVVRYSKGKAKNEFVYSTETKATGLASIIASGPLTMNSRFLVGENGLTPMGLITKDDARQGKDNAQLSFDWKAQQANYKDRKGEKSVKLINGIQDVLSVQIAVMKDLAAGKTPLKYSVIEKGGRLRAHEYHKIKEETLSVSGRSYRTVRYDLKRQDSNRVMIYWFVPELDFLPVRMRQIKIDKETKKKKTVFTANLTSVEGLQQ